jgi:hypothetical protein
LKDELEARRIDSRSWTSASGRLVGGKPFSRGALYLIFAEPYPSRIRIAGNKAASFFTAISRWRVVSRRALDASGFWQG